MPPKKGKQTVTIASIDAPISRSTNNGEETHTPEESPRKRSGPSITQAQKQALLDNLQLEITERARRLRAQYAQQAQALRTRLEMRVNRIPKALRDRKMQDLLDEHTLKQNPKPTAIVPVQPKPQESEIVRKTLKRQSDQISTDDDINKENAPAQSEDLPNPKKRAKPTTTANTKAVRTASRAKPAAVASTVLSPKSHNSRTLPRSPIKTSFEKPQQTTQLTRPASPTKPTARTGAGVARTASRQQATKRGAAVPSGSDTEGRTSEASTTSAGTTVISKGTAKGRTAAMTKKGPAPVKTVAAKRAAPAAAKKENVPPPATRSLRKRA